jgi:8-oxo-dGTP pyrophosphatase MutT (NUDIX family)
MPVVRTPSGQRVNVSQGIANSIASGALGSGYKVERSSGGGGGGGGSSNQSSSSQTQTQPTQTVYVSQAVADRIAQNPSEYSSYKYSVVDVPSGRTTGQVIQGTGGASSLGTFSGKVEDVTGLTPKQVASGESLSARYIVNNQQIAYTSGGGGAYTGTSPTGYKLDLATGATAYVKPTEIINVKPQTGGEKFIYSNAGQVIGVESALFRQSMPISAYEQNIQKLQTYSPRVGYVDTTTGKISTEQQYTPTLGFVDSKFSTIKKPTLTQVYLDPETNKPIENVASYYKEKGLPTTYETPLSPEEQVQRFNEIKSGGYQTIPVTYDVQGLRQKASSSKQGILLGDEYISSAKGSGEASVLVGDTWESAFNLALLATGAKAMYTIGKSVGGLGKEGIIQVGKKIGIKVGESVKTDILKLASTRAGQFVIYTGIAPQLLVSYKDIAGSTVQALSKYSSSQSLIEKLDKKLSYSDLNLTTNEYTYKNRSEQGGIIGQTFKDLRYIETGLKFGAGIASDLIPRNLGQLGLAYLGYKAIGYGMKQFPVTTEVVNLGVSGYQFQKAEGTRGKVEAALFAVPSIIGLGYRGALKGFEISRGSKAVAKTQTVLGDVGVVARDRPSLFLEVVDAKGNIKGYALGKSRNANELISFGGVREKGETAKQGAIREFLEETGFGAELKRGASPQKLLKQIGVEDINELTKFKSLSEEKFTVFLGRIKEKNLVKLKASSDVEKIVVVKPKLLSAIDISAKNPRTVPYGSKVERFLGLGDNVRIPEAQILGRIDELKSINREIASYKSQGLQQAKQFIGKKYGKEALGMSNKELLQSYLLEKRGKAFTTLDIPGVERSFIRSVFRSGDELKIQAGLQSRYDIPKQFYGKYFDTNTKQYKYIRGEVPFKSKQKTLTFEDIDKSEYLKIFKRTGEKGVVRQYLVSGTGRDLVLTNDKILKVIGGKAERSTADVLFFQPPVKSGGKPYAGLSYTLGGSSSEMTLSLLPNLSKRRILYGKFRLDRELFGYASKRQGMLDQPSITRKQGVKTLQKELNVLGKERKSIGPTAKPLFEVESELGAYPGTEFKFKRTGVTFLEGKPVFVQKIVRADKTLSGKIEVLRKQVSQEKSLAKRIAIERKIQSLGGVSNKFIESEIFQAGKIKVPVSSVLGISSLMGSEAQQSTRTNTIIRPYAYKPQAVTESIVKYSKTEQAKPSKYYSSYSEPKIQEFSIIPEEKQSGIGIERRLNRFEQYRYTKPAERYSAKPYTQTSRYFQAPTKYSYTQPYKQSGAKYSYVSKSDVRPPRINKTFRIAFGSEKERSIKKVKSYALQLKRRGKFRTIRSDLTRGQALKLGSDVTLRNLARTFKVVPTGTTKEVFGIEEQQFFPEDRLFRQYQVKKGRRIQRADIFIQRQKALLQTTEEKRAIQQAKRSNINKLINFTM